MEKRTNLMRPKSNATEREIIDLVSAGATVWHDSPFDDLPSAPNDVPLSQRTIDEWVKPFYRMSIRTEAPEWIAACARVTPAITLELLRHLNWRSRVVAARFIAIRRMFEMQRELSTLFLKSEVCDAGNAYCLVLARIANAEAVETLCRYLDYYLSQPDLYFQQNEALAALMFLDEKLGLRASAQFVAPYQRFIADKSGWDLSRDCRQLRAALACLEAIEPLVQSARLRLTLRNSWPIFMDSR